MKPQPKTLVLVALASGMLASAYLVAPAPAATTGLVAARPVTRLAPAPVPSVVASNIKALQAPVPLVVGKHDQYFDTSTVRETSATPAVKTTDLQQDSAARSDAMARNSIEKDGYRSVRGLVRAPDGSWHGRALRGGTEIAVSVDPNGGVSQD
ncbi:MAG: hypothetical protein WCP68_23175 [Enhydrobacter sp.]